MGMPTKKTSEVHGVSRPPLERMLRIHDALAERRYPNSSTLAASLEVNPKTILRDLEFMRDRMNLPIEWDARNRGFHYTESVEAFPTMKITEGELIALLVAEKALHQYRGTPYEDRLVAALRKLEQALPETVSLNLADLNHTISFRTTAEPVVNLPIMETLFRAAQEREQLRLSYKKPGAKQAEDRVVDPYHVANVNGDWYLFAFDHTRNAIRTFAPVRILGAKLTGKTFARPARFQLDQQLRDSFGVHSREGEFDVVIQIEESISDYIREKRWHTSQELRELADGRLELRMRLGSLQEVQRWVLGRGGGARVIGPPELLASVREAAARLVERHHER